MEKNILIAGGSGNLGSHFDSNIFCKHKLFFSYFKNKLYKNNKKYIKINLNKKCEIIKILTTKKINLIIYTSGLTDVNICEKNKKKCYNINFEQVKIITDLAKKYNIKIIYISTDSVYATSKHTPPFKENFSTNSVNYYQFCKVKAENYILKKLKNYLIVRTNPFGLNKHKNSIYWLFDNLRKKKEVFGFYDIIYNPIFAGDLVKYIFRLIDLNLVGKINIGTIGSIDKFNFARLIKKKWKINGKIIPKSIYDFDILPRKLNTTLNLSKLKKILKKKKLITINQTINNFYNYEKRISK